MTELSLEDRRENAQARDWLHHRDQAVDRRNELLALIRDQSSIAMTEAPPCACCALVLEWRKLYRCFHCDLWFCPGCSRRHFGMPS